LVIRALPPAANATSRELGSDLDASLRRLGLVPGRPPEGGAPAKQTRSRDTNHDNGPAV
jgi:ribonuclease P protein component